LLGNEPTILGVQRDIIGSLVEVLVELPRKGRFVGG